MTTASASVAELDRLCEDARGIKCGAAFTGIYTTCSVMVDELKLVDGTSPAVFQVLSRGVEFEANNGDTDVTLDATGVVKAGDKLWRVVNTKSGSGTVFHQVSAEDEDALIAGAVKANPGVKPSFTRWLTISKNREWPAQAQPGELEMFGPHCCISSALLELKQQQKRARDAASRKRRATTCAPAHPAATPPAKSARMTVTFEGSPQEVLEAMRQAARQSSVEEG